MPVICWLFFSPYAIIGRCRCPSGFGPPGSISASGFGLPSADLDPFNTSRYYWARVLEDCDETVKRCDVCQRTSKKFEKPSAQLHPIKVKDTVWHRIGIDLVGPLPETSRGNKYLITCTCYFRKWPEAAPLKSKSAEGMWYPILKLVVTNWDLWTRKKKKEKYNLLPSILTLLLINCSEFIF